MSCMLKCPIHPITNPTPVYSHTKMEQMTEEMFASLLFTQYPSLCFQKGLREYP
jgi:hypothetical protein